MANYSHLFSPITLGSLGLRNRVFMTTHGPRLSQNRYLAYLEVRAQGVGLVGLPAGFGVGDAPTAPGRFTREYMGDFDAHGPSPTSDEGIAFHDNRVIPLLRAQAEMVHRQGALCVGQLHHAGASNSNDNLQPVVGPSNVPDDHRRSVPHALEQLEIDTILETFAHGARRIETAGLDGVEVHAAHGYLIHQFLSPISNQRTDKYGGSIDSRSRFLYEIIDAIRSSTAQGFPVGIRLGGPDTSNNGFSLTDLQHVAGLLEKWGVAYINLSAGTYTGLKQGLGLPYVGSAYVDPGPNVATARAIKSAVDVPVIVSGRINSIELAETILSSGAADMVGMVRALIADPNLISKASSGKPDQITPCIGMNECHYPGRQTICAVNPSAGREAEMRIEPAAVPKRVFVIGGGPAGIEASLAAAARGHFVVLYEKSAELGGLIRTLGKDPARPDLALYVQRLVSRLERSTVELQLGQPFDTKLIKVRRPDFMVIATGAEPYRPDVPGVDDSRVITAIELLEDPSIRGGRALVVGGLDDYLAPLTTADLLASRGALVEVISENFSIGQAVEPATLYALTNRLLEKKVTLSPLTKLVAIDEDAVQLSNVFTGTVRVTAGYSTIVLACGSRPKVPFATKVDGLASEVHVIGDSLAPRRLVNATLEGARVGRLI